MSGTPLDLQSSLEPTPDEETQLWKSFKGDGSLAARETLFSCHAAFARNIAGRHYRERTQGDLELPDLRQLAYAGLLEALDRFDPGRGIPFRAYAASRISGSVKDGVTRTNEVREQIEWRRRTQRERTRSLAGDGLNEAGAASEALEKFSEIAVGLALGFMLEDSGLFSPDDAENRPTGYDSIAWAETVAALRAELQDLPLRERAILHQHYENGVNFDQLAKVLSVTKGRVSQLHRAALMHLKKRLDKRGHFRLER